MANWKDHEESEMGNVTRKVMDGMVSGSAMQTRFKRIPDSHLNRETIAGIRDMNLGRIRNGKPTGRPIIRVDTGLNTRTSPHINIDPRGYPSANNPHIPVTEGFVKNIKGLNNVLKYVGAGLTVAAVVVDVWNIGSALKNDIDTSEKADEIIADCEYNIDKLKEALKVEKSSKMREQIENAVELLKAFIKDVKLLKKNIPVNTIKTIGSVAGGWSGGALAGGGGALAGTYTGVTVGSCFGPVGAVVGAPVGAVIGAVTGGIGGGIVGSHLGKRAAEKGLSYMHD
ncbi:uncharacterized protein LOC117219903 [Megalopta genalis]|uniref:uncharacterized protein LOC117219903 n=1 Tax=Megalopta genalis TaxID=115081 RepID=UPI003FD418FD